MVKIMNKTKLLFKAVVSLFILNSMFLFSQGGDEAFRVRLESILSKFKNYRFSEIAIYKIKDIKDVRNAIKSKEDETTPTNPQGGEPDQCVKNADKTILQYVDNQVKEGKSLNEIRRDMLGRGMSIPPDIECIVNFYLNKSAGPVKQLRSAYAITTRMTTDQIVPGTIIALIVSTDDESIEKNLNQPAPASIYTYPELINFSVDKTQFRANTLYELVQIAFEQGNVENRTLEAQGIGGFLIFGPKRYGVTNSLVSNRYEVKPTDVQKFLRISEGQPNEMDKVTNELIISPELIRWSRYQMDLAYGDNGEIDTISSISNSNLPKYGVELRYGIEDINIPSLWSERLSLNALWQGTKLGIVLPTNGWSGLTKDMMDITRKFTYAGVGINGTIDFPVLLLPASGIFHLSGAYIFGDAQPANYKTRNYKEDPQNYIYKPGDDDYLIRANATLFYTFGVSVDDDYMLRFGLGASVYSAEKWNYKKEEDPDTREPFLTFRRAATETIGGISGKIDFMAKGLSTPVGGTIQYFDEGLYGNLWLQIPIVENRLHIRIDAKGYFKAFTEDPRPWENESVFIPMARIILNF